MNDSLFKEVILTVKGGELVAKHKIPRFTAILNNESANPEVLIWGNRVFKQTENPDVYEEIFAYAII